MAILTPKPKHDHATLTFPKGFLWGTATSAYQVEGNNFNSDWWEAGKKNKIPPADKSCDQYHLYEEDFDLAQKFHQNSHRLSIEWSRIEPEEGKFNYIEIAHYISVLKALKARGMVVMLTLHHFSNPIWFANKGGWENWQAPFYFERFVKKVVPEIKDYVDLWITINEPGVAMWGGYLAGKWPPFQKTRLRALRVLWHFARAHCRTYKVIHQSVPHAKVGITQNVASFAVFHQHSIMENLTKIILDKAVNHFFYFLTGKKTHDFLGINYYFHQYISLNGKKRLPNLVDMSAFKKDVSDMGWEIHPEGMFDVLMDFSDYHLPIYITENGVASTNDDRRVRFLILTLKEIYHAISFGVNVRGYFHWSLLDNYEWADGFDPRFGLIEVDYRTLKRIPRPSAYIYGDIAKNNGIRHDLMKFLGHRIHANEVMDIPGIGKL